MKRVTGTDVRGVAETVPSRGRMGLRVVSALSLCLAAPALLASPPDVPTSSATAPATEAQADAGSARPVTDPKGVAPDARSSVKASLVVKVGSREKASADLVARLEAVGGYFTQQDQDGLKARVPREEIRAVIEFAEGLGVVVGRGYEATDVGAELERLRSRLEGRESMLIRYDSVLRSASAAAVVSVEREITRLIEEIEGLKGNIRFLEHQMAYAELEVRFQFRDRAAPVADGSSSFRWLNTVNLMDLVATFRREP